MASAARLEKVGSLFARVNGLLRKGVFSAEEKPVWFDVYALHPPYDEPRYDREPKNIQIREILYEEDKVRAKFHSKESRLGYVELTNTQTESKTQEFINLYSHLKQQGALDDEKIYEVALQQLKAGAEDQHDEPEISIDFDDDPIPELGLSANFAKALDERNEKVFVVC